MIRSDRVRELLLAKGISQTELARRISVTQGAIAKIVSANPSGSSHLHKIARELETTPEYLTGETDDPSGEAVQAPSAEAIAEQFDLVPLAEVDVSYGLGAAFIDDAPVVEIRQFPRRWLAGITSSPSTSLFIARGRGTSMEPTLRNGDMLIIDRSERQVRDQDELWAFTIGEIGMIKRLRIRGEKVTILSENPNVPDDYAHPEEINVVGRVIFIGRVM